MESSAFTLEGIFPPNPQAKRANRVRWSLKPSGDEQILAYGCQKNLVIRNLSEPSKTKIYNFQVLNNITCAKYSSNGNYIAYGDEKGGVRVIGWSAAENDWVMKYDNPAFLNGTVNDLSWTDDH
jgi:hypothetical protein